jgi:tetratricopeptide (TPR) repeat protein
MATVEQFSEQQVIRITGVAASKLAYWQKLGLVRPQVGKGGKLFGFHDLISLRTIKQLTDQRVPASQVRRAVQALVGQLEGVQAPLAELRILWDGRSIIVQHDGLRLEPLSGQLLLSFETRELAEKIQSLPARSAGDWLAQAIECETDPARHGEACEAYRRAIELRPEWAEARLNLGTLLFEDGNITGAEEEFRRAVEASPKHALAHFNLAAALDEMNRSEEAREHLLEALRLSPDFLDACYNLAAVCEKLHRLAEARRYWSRYLEFDSASAWAAEARRRLVTLRTGPTAPTNQAS